MGSLLVEPVRRPIGEPPSDLPFEDVEFQSGSGNQLHGWFLMGDSGAGGVVLLHGVRSDRRSMVGRARFLHQQGYSVLLFDFQSHGESTGDRITFGHLESLDARAAVHFLRNRLPGEPVAAIGTSLGGVACVLGTTPLPIDALVLEAVYPDVKQAIRNRLTLRLGPIGPLVSPLLIYQMKPRLGVSPEQLRPLDAISTIRAPVLIIAGVRDRRTTIEESAALFFAAPEPKEFWQIEDAAHVDFHRHSPEEYEDTVSDFLRKYLSAAG